MSALLLKIIIPIFIHIFIIGIMGFWKIFKKANYPSWAAYVPIYNIIIMFDLIGWEIGAVIIPFTFAILIFLLEYNIIFVDNNILAILTISFYLLLLIYHIMLMKSLSKAFQKSGGFTVGLILLPLIFFPILAYGKSKYDNNLTNEYEYDSALLIAVENNLLKYATELLNKDIDFNYLLNYDDVLIIINKFQEQFNVQLTNSEAYKKRLTITYKEIEQLKITEIIENKKSIKLNQLSTLIYNYFMKNKIDIILV